MIRVLHQILQNAAKVCPEKIAVFHKQESKTYAHFQKESEQLAQVLISKGIVKGDRVAFFLEKRFEKVSCIFGISMAGAVFVPIRRLSHSSQAAHILKDSGSKILITTYNRLSLIAENREMLPELHTIIAIGKIEDAKEAANELTLAGINIIDWSDALNVTETLTLPYVVEPDLAAILYTSGSTGSPKGVVLSHLNLVAGAKTVAEYLKINENDRLLSILTFGFDYGLNQLTTTFLCRAQIVLLDYLFPKDIITTAKKFEITGIAAVATTWIQLLQIPWKGEELPSLRYFTNSGGAIPEKLVREIRARAPKVDLYLMYGLTEAFRSTFLDPSLTDQFPTSMGKAIPGEEILVLDENHQAVKSGEIGELVHRGVLVAQGYWNAPELTAIRYRHNPLQSKEVPNPEIVVYSGDRVRIEANGLLYFVGRNDEMIKSAGNRISPTEIEEIVYSSGFVSAVMALGIPHEIYGQSIYLILSGIEGQSVTQELLLDYCKKTMPPYMIPQGLEIRDDLPRNANGKLDRSLIKKQVFEKLGIKSK